MEPIIWAATIAGAVSMIGNAATVIVARYGRDNQREQITVSAQVEIARLNAEAERIRDERREAARHERRELYGRLLRAIRSFEAFGRGDPGFDTDDEYQRVLNDFEELHAEVLLIGTSDVQSAAGEALDALHDVGAHMRSYAGGPAQRFQAAFTEDRRGDAITLRVHT